MEPLTLGYCTPWLAALPCEGEALKIEEVGEM
jgi:hypothetical protein